MALDQFQCSVTFCGNDRKLGYVSTALLIVNRMIGTGIFSTPSTIMQATNSVGAALLFWVLGGLMSFVLLAYIELGCTLPRSGGEKNYLERIYSRPKYWTTCIFAVEFIFFAHSAANSISFSRYLLYVIHGLKNSQTTACGRLPSGRLLPSAPLSQEWISKGISIITISVVCLVHAFFPKFGIWVSNGLGAFKIVILLVIVFAGFAALGGHLNTTKPDNFSSFDGFGDACPNAPSDSNSSAANFAIALLQVLYSYTGWESANYVLSEVRHPQKTLKWAAPIASLVVTSLYILANIAYFAASTKEQIAGSGVTVAASFFSNVFGSGVFVTRVLPAIIALSILGNIFSQTYCNSRVKQELAKEGALPFSRFFASDWPIKTPTGGFFLHWLFSVILIVGPRTSDAYPFLTNLATYTQTIVKILIGVGLVYLVLSPSSNWVAQRTSLHTSPIATIAWVLSLLFILIAPFIPNDRVTPTIPWYVFPTVGISVIALATAYWFYWFKLWPLFGWAVETKIEPLPDGSERVKYFDRNNDATKSRVSLRDLGQFDAQKESYEHYEPGLNPLDGTGNKD
ncbi:amino acid transporter [Xylariaceae sp. AK1471]|nr:amino acid transporter [Xylariaceae sp. AK1471]